MTPIDPICDVESAIRQGSSLSALCDAFAWSVPEQLNVAEMVCTRHANGQHRLALIAETENGQPVETTFDQLNAAASRLATVMLEAGVRPRDRVAVVLPQRVETALVHLAAQRIGAVSLPLSVLFGDDALRYRLKDSGTSFLVVAEERFEVIHAMQQDLPELHCVLRVSQRGPVPVDDEGCGLIGPLQRQDGPAVSDAADTADTRGSSNDGFWHRLNRAARHEGSAKTQADDAAFLLYTSGTTGPPKGALIPQRALLGNLPGFECSHNGFPKDDDVMFTPADWAWTGGLLDALMPAWYYGVPVVALDARKFDTRTVVSLMSRHKVTTAFIPPTALKMMRREHEVLKAYPLHLRSIMSAGETVGKALVAWGQSVLNVPINEMCGQTEHNYLIGNCSALTPIRPGSMGRAYPGHRVGIMGVDGQLVPDGETGEIVAHRDDPVHFLGYWNNPQASAKKYTGEWFHTGDTGHVDQDGYLWFHGRADDVIASAGYRIGPGEIENCALTHDAVLHVAAIGVPDPDEGLRGDVVKLCVVVRSGVTVDDALKDSLQSHIREHLAAYEYPRIIEFFDHLPMTTTGKVQRNVLRQWHQDS